MIRAVPSERFTAAVLRPVDQSATLAINERVASVRSKGRHVMHLGFGVAGLPAAPELVRALAGAAAANDYRPSAGSRPLLEAAAGYLTRRGLDTTAESVVAGPGSKALLLAAMKSLDGDVVLAAPSWVTYAAQAALLGKRVGWAAIPAASGGVPDPAALVETITRMRRAGANPRILVLTCPDNPTGTVASRQLIEAVCAVAVQQHLTIISDEIYRDLVYEPEHVVSPSSLLPDQTIVTTGLSKNLALGGWRIGIARFPDSPYGDEIRESVIGIASEVWSSCPAPMEDVATWAFTDPEPLVRRLHASCRLHRAVAEAAHGIFVDTGIPCRPPQAAFYLYPDFDEIRERISGKGLTTGADFTRMLLDDHGVAVLPGSAFGDDVDAWRVRVSTTSLYGTTVSEREAALASANPVDLPWIAAGLERLRDVVTRLSATRAN